MSSESIKFGPSSMESDKFITLCDNKDGQVIIERNLQATKRRLTTNVQLKLKQKGIELGPPDTPLTANRKRTFSRRGRSLSIERLRSSKSLFG